MPYTPVDLANIRAAISTIIARMASGSKEIVSASIGDIATQYEPDSKSLKILSDLEKEATYDAGIATRPGFFLVTTSKGL